MIQLTAKYLNPKDPGKGFQVFMGEFHVASAYRIDNVDGNKDKIVDFVSGPFKFPSSSVRVGDPTNSKAADVIADRIREWFEKAGDKNAVTATLNFY